MLIAILRTTNGEGQSITLIISQNRTLYYMLKFTFYLCKKTANDGYLRHDFNSHHSVEFYDHKIGLEMLASIGRGV